MSLRLRLAAGACALAAGLAGCGGGDDDAPKVSERAKGKTPIAALGDKAPPKALRSLTAEEGDTASAGTDESYEPTGEIVADSGFRPDVDGFGFENYGNDVGPENLTPAEVESFFGEQVCVRGSGTDCVLTAPAKRWMENENERMAGGHCMGFSVAAIRMFQQNLKAAEFGAEQTAALEIVDNPALQTSIAEHWVYQDLPLVQEAIVQGTPSKIVDILTDTLVSGEEDYTLGILMADGTGGHAITPFAIEDKGDGEMAILVYDNNFPGIVRAVEVNVQEETWRYVGGTNPQNLGEVYEGDDETQSMVLLPTSPGDQQQPCPFCGGSEADGGEALGSVLPKAKQYAEITLRGNPSDHPHLIFTDDKGRTTGILDGKLLQEIPGIEVDQGFSVRNWESSPEPRYRVPAGRNISFAIDGSNLERPRRVDLDLVGNGLVVAIDSIRIAPGQTDTVFVSGGGEGLYYELDGKKEEAPEFYAGVEDEGASYTFAATAVGVKRGSTIGMLVDRDSGTVLLDAEGVKGGIDGEALFGLLLGKESESGSRLWGTDALRLSGKRKDGVYFNYKETPKKGRPLTLEVGPEDGPFKTVRAPYQDE
ncbi:hypothetical protein [Paraconexibacter algicola]|uniref:Lipoprotein n=1 Tax=Paraconexibacter algicola TaxID=2133960 RepID=A0A2T4UIT3_9ACTN|nr:hypothetical protein [Paraconexibacter algicola]PTL59117.1 hypothetical protein C7Y72_05370 [Paraconexibacter algicola]